MSVGSPVALVTGASGAIGPLLVNKLVGDGHLVRALVRSSPPIGLWPAAVQVYEGDLGDVDSLRRAANGVTTVFHLAAMLHNNNPSPEMRQEYERVNVQGTRNVVEAAQSSGASRIIFFSTVSVYGPTGKGPVDEDSPPRPDTIYAETKLRAEGLVLASRDRSLSEPLGVVLRMGAVYGPRMKGNYVALANALASGRFVQIGRGDNLRTLVYAADAVRAAILAAEHPAAVGKIYNVSDGTVHRLSEIIEAVCDGLGHRLPGFSVPVSVARPTAAILDRVSALLGHPQQFSRTIDKLLESSAVTSERIQRELGFRPEYDLRRGWLETVVSWQADQAL